VLPFLAAGISGCGGSGAASSVGRPGEEQAKPGDGFFIVDPNLGGSATRLHLAEMLWGRLVDVHDVDAAGNPSSAPIYRDLVVHENVRTDGDYLLDTNPVTQRTRLVVRRSQGVPGAGGSATFAELLREAEQGLAPIRPRDEDGPGVFSLVARNAALVLRFDDLLEDGEEARAALAETVRLLSGYPPLVPFSARAFFDPNHGGLAGGVFHSTRVIVDLSVSEAEMAASPVPIAINPLGLPASQPDTGRPNASIRIPTRLSPGSGQFTLLRGLSGVPLAQDENGPVDLDSPARELVRAMRAGNASDLNNGFLLDLDAPELLGAWRIRIEDARVDTDGRPGLDWRVDSSFTTTCRVTPRPGDVCAVNETLLEVREGPPPSGDAGRVLDLRVRVAAGKPVAAAAELLGTGEYLTPFDARLPVEPSCWLAFQPPPGSPPGERVSPETQIRLRFSEPMDPASIDALETLLLVRGDATVQPASSSIVVGQVGSALDLRRFTLTPVLPLAHQQAGERYHLLFGRLTDLSGKGLRAAPGEINFSIDPAAAPRRNGGIVVRFGEPEEIPPASGCDFRGQFKSDLERGRMLPRPAILQSAPVDRTVPVPSVMVPFPPGLLTPLAPLGSKLQAVYRYCDLGWRVRDESKYDVDVMGLAWAPVGEVRPDFFEGFEIRLAHSFFLPDECNDGYGPVLPFSGLRGWPFSFTDNLLFDPLSPQEIVHPRSLGYQINPSEAFHGPSGTKLLPYPLNRGSGPLESFTWRDTAVLARGGPFGWGIPLCIESRSYNGLGLEERPGTIARAGAVPSIGLPLLMEFRCYPSDTALGLNAHDVSIASFLFAMASAPNFRAFSTGGIDMLGRQERVEPDLELVPRGGFNPSSTPPGRRTVFSADNSFYIGQVDHVARVTRVHSAWIDCGFDAPDYLRPLVRPAAEEQPLGTRVVLEFRGATGFLGTVARPFDARRLDSYGDPLGSGEQPLDDAVLYLGGERTWSASIDAVDGARYLQLRLSFLANIDTGQTPELDALGLVFESE
jgi:hypothetical protein